jgi:hypothetical protein
LRFSTFAASFIVGLAIFLFLVRYVRKFADHIFPEEDKVNQAIDDSGLAAKESMHGGWNLIHVFTSFKWVICQLNSHYRRPQYKLFRGGLR